VIKETKKNIKLSAYLRYYIRNRLNNSIYSAEDIVNDVYCAILTSRNLSFQLRAYLEADVIPPKGEKLSLLKAVIIRTKLKYINKANVHITGKRKGNVMDAMKFILKSKEDVE